MAGESGAFPVTGNTTALYYFQGGSLATSAGDDEGPNNLDLVVSDVAPGYGLDGYYADAAIEAGDDGIECFVGSSNSGLETTNADTIFPVAGWQLELMIYVQTFINRFSTVFSVFKDSDNWLRILNDASNRRLQLDWEIGTVRSIIRDATADTGHTDTWVCMIISYLEDSNDGAEGGAVKYAYGRPQTDADISIITDYQTGAAGQNMPTFDAGTKFYIGREPNIGGYTFDGEFSTANIRSISAMPSDADIQTRYDEIVIGESGAPGGIQAYAHHYIHNCNKYGDILHEPTDREVININSGRY